MADMQPEADTWTYADGSVILRLYRWGEATKKALSTAHFDGLQVGSGVGTWAHLEPYAEKIRWLHSPSLKSPVGLETLTYVEKITYGGIGSTPEVAFDYRKLPRLTSMFCHTGSDLRPEYLNHPNIERLDLEGIKPKEKDLAFLSNAHRLRALRVGVSPIQTLNGVERLSELRELRMIQIRSLSDISALRHANQLEVLELDQLPKLNDISPIHELGNLRMRFVDAKKAWQPDIAWVSKLAKLECLFLCVETEAIDWSVFAKHPCLHDIVCFAKAGFSGGTDEEIVRELSAEGRTVNAIKRYPKDVFPAFHIEFVPKADDKWRKPLHTYRNNLIF